MGFTLYSLDLVEQIFYIRGSNSYLYRYESPVVSRFYQGHLSQRLYQQVQYLASEQTTCQILGDT